MVVEIRPKIDISAVLTGVTVTLPPEIIAEIDTVKNIESGSIAVTTGALAVSTGRVDVGTVTNVGSGRVQVLTGRVEVMTGRIEITTGRVEIFSQPYLVTTWITSGTTLLATGYTSPDVDVRNYARKTIHGWIDTAATLRVFIGADTGLVHPYPISTQTLSSGTAFSFTFTDACAILRATLSVTATGRAGIWISRTAV